MTVHTNARDQATTYDYCECGALDSFTDALTNTTEYFYDYQGRMTGTKFPDGSWTTNRYDALGRIVVAGDSSGLNTTNYFNNQGLLTAPDEQCLVLANHSAFQSRVPNLPNKVFPHLRTIIRQ